MSFSELLQWWNLIFILPFIGGIMYLVLMAIGVISSEADTDAGMEFNHDVEFEHDMGVEHDAEHDMDDGVLLKILSIFGFGKVPVSIIIISLCFIWGFSGWASNMLFKNILKFPVIFFWVSLAVAFFSSVIVTRYLAIFISKIMPATETYVTKRAELIGKRAEALVRITRDSGSARLHDQYGNLLDINCRLKGDQEEVLPGGRVVLMEYNEDEGVYYVGTDPLGQLQTYKN